MTSAAIAIDNATLDLASLDAWLFSTVLPHWQRFSLNAQNGVPVECLDMRGLPLIDVPRRGRVMPRQLFSFARALRLGFLHDDPAQRESLRKTLAAGLNTLRNRAFSPDKGFPSQIDENGTGAAYDAVLYDHAFIALAGAELDALGIDGGRQLADTAFELIETQFRDPNTGGYHSVANTPGPKLANPHMHLLEASLLDLAVTLKNDGDANASKNRVANLTDLALTHFIDSETGFIAEKCGPAFDTVDDNWVEPGHCFEWAYLLLHAGEALGNQNVRQAARTLFETSETLVEADGLVVDQLGATPPTYRLWPQLERLRCLATFNAPDAIPALLQTIQRHYLSKGPEAGWVDKLDAQKNPLGDRVPASMLYHLMTAIPVITRPDQRF